MVTRRSALRFAAGMGVVGGAALSLTALASKRGAAAEKSYPPVGEFVSAEGARLHLLDVDRAGPNAPVAVLIHGASGNLRDFSFDFVDRLADRWRVIALDRPGFGHSERGRIEDPHRPDVQARLLRAAVQAKGVERAVLVGHSFGAAPALSWAIDAPESVVGVVSLAGASHPWPGTAGRLYEIGATPVIGGLLAAAAGLYLTEERVKAAVNRFFAPQAAPEGYVDYVGVGLALRAKTLRYNAEDITFLKAFLAERRHRYATLDRPIEIVHGAADRIVGIGYHADKLVADAPQARLTTLHNVGHMPHHADPDACIAAMERVLAAA